MIHSLIPPRLGRALFLRCDVEAVFRKSFRDFFLVSFLRYAMSVYLCFGLVLNTAVFRR